MKTKENFLNKLSKLILIIGILFLFGCSSKKKEPIKDIIQEEKIEVDSTQIKIGLEHQRVKPICKERGHIFEECKTKMWHLHEIKRIGRKFYISGHMISNRIVNSIPDNELIDYPDRSELVNTAVTYKRCYRCFETIKEVETKVVKIIWKK